MSSPKTAPTLRKRERILRGLGHAGRSIAFVVTFAGALVYGVTIHSRTPAFRRLTTTLGNEILGGLFEGKIVLGEVKSISIGRSGSVHLSHVEIFDPEGKRVIGADDIESEIDLDKLVRALARGDAPYVDLGETTTLANVDLVLDVDEAGVPKIAKTFEPKKKPRDPKKPSAPPSAGPPKDPTLHVPKVIIGHAHVHGNITGKETPLDGYGDALEAKVNVEHDVAKIELVKGKLTLVSPNAGARQKAPVIGTGTGNLEVRLAASQLKGSASFEGTCGELPVKAHAEIDGEEADATVDIPRVTPEAIAKSFADVPVKVPVQIHAHAHKKGPTVHLDAHAAAQTGATMTTVLTAKGELDTREGNAFKIDADVSHADVRAFGVEGVETDLSAKIHGEGVLAPIVTTTFRVETSEGKVAGERVPPVALQGKFEGKKLTATFQAKDPGVDARGNVELDVPTKVVTFDVQARSNSLRAIAQTQNKVGGSATARVQGKIDIASKTIHATTKASADGLELDALTAKHVDANGVLSGPLESPLLDVGFTGTEMKLTANGKQPLEYPEASGRARVSFVPTPRVLDASINVSSAKGDQGISASAAGIHVANGVVEARGLRVTGLGEPLELDARIGRGEWHVRAKSDGIDLNRAATMTGIKELKSLPPGARARVDVDVRQGAAGADGHFDVVLRSPAGGALPVAMLAEAHGVIEKGKLTGNAKVEAEDMGIVEVTRASVDVPSQLDGKSLQRTTGTLDLRGAFNLNMIALFAGDKIEHVSGTGRFEGRIERRDPEALPLVRLTAKTEALEVGLNLDEKSDALLIAGVDTSTHVSWDGRTNDAEVALMLWDQHGRLLSANGKSKVPLLKWLTGQEKVTADTIGALELMAVADVPRRDLRNMPTFLQLRGVRGLADAQVSIEGTLAHPRLALTANASGLDEDREGKQKEKQRELEKVREKEREKWAKRDPSKRGTMPPQAMMRGLPQAQQPPPTFEPLDGQVQARWDGERAVLTFSLDERERRRGPGGPGGGPGGPRGNWPGGPVSPTPNSGAPLNVPRGGGRPPPPNDRPRPQVKTPGHLRGLVIMTDARMTDVLHGKSLKELPWRASTEIEVENLALAALGLPHDVTGSLTGRASLKELNHDPSFEANLHIDNFGAGGAKVQKVDVTTKARDKSLFVHAKIEDQSTSQATQATFQLAAQSPRVQGLKFDWDKQAVLRLDYAIQNGRLALLSPLVKRAIPEIDGRVDGAGSVTIEGKSQVFEGGLAVQEGRFYANVIGDEISNLTAIARFDRTGTWRIDDASGKIGAGTFRASASGRLKGFDLTDAEATLVATNGVPISSESATFAEATGEVKVTLKRNIDDDTAPMLVTVDVPRANVELPDRSTQQLESLDPDATIAVGLRKKGVLDTTVIGKSRGGTGKLSEQKAAAAGVTTKPTVTRITATLGEQVRLQGRGLDVALTGRTAIELAEELKMTGQIDLRGGTIEVHGRRFNVDRGTITFQEGRDPGDPTIVAAAYWDAPDRTRVWVEFVGPLKTGKLTLRSEPPYSKNEILSVLLFGRPDPNMAAAGGTSGQKTGDASGATAVGSGFVAGDLNRVLSEIDENLDIETDTLSGNRTRTKLGRSFFDRRLKVQIGYAPGKTYREPDTTYVFLNWQFIPKWSIVATRGDRGTSILDVLFQHRY